MYQPREGFLRQVHPKQALAPAPQALEPSVSAANMWHACGRQQVGPLMQQVCQGVLIQAQAQRRQLRHAVQGGQHLGAPAVHHLCPAREACDRRGERVRHDAPTGSVLGFLPGSAASISTPWPCISSVQRGGPATGRAGFNRSTRQQSLFIGVLGHGWVLGRLYPVHGVGQHDGAPSTWPCPVQTACERWGELVSCMESQQRAPHITNITSSMHLWKATNPARLQACMQECMPSSKLPARTLKSISDDGLRVSPLSSAYPRGAATAAHGLRPVTVTEASPTPQALHTFWNDGWRVELRIVSVHRTLPHAPHEAPFVVGACRQRLPEHRLTYPPGLPDGNASLCCQPLASASRRILEPTACLAQPSACCCRLL